MIEARRKFAVSAQGVHKKNALSVSSRHVVVVRREVGALFFESDFFIQAGEALAPNEWKRFGPTSTLAANPIARMLPIQQ